MSLTRSFLIFALVAVWTNAFAQHSDVQFPWWSPNTTSSLPITDSLSRYNRLSNLSLNVEHTLSLYQWGVGTAFTTLGRDVPLHVSTIWANPSVSLSAEGRSQLREDTRTRTTEGIGYLEATYPLVGGISVLSVSLFGTTYSLSRNAATSLYDVGTLQNLSDGYALVGGKYMPWSELVVSGAAGIAYKSFLFGRSNGNIIQARAVLSTISIAEGSVIDAEAFLDERRFSSLGELGRNDAAKAHLITTFGDEGSNEATAGVSLKRRDFYFTVDTNAPTARQERSEFTVELHNLLRYPLVQKKLLLLVEGNFIPRSVSRKTSGINFASASTGLLTSSTFLLPSITTAFDLGISSQLQWIVGTNTRNIDRTPLITAEIKYSENSETNDISLSELTFASTAVINKLSSTINATSFDAGQSALTITGTFPVFERDALQANISSRLFRYDTPSQDNRDDRDELYLNAAVKYHHFFTTNLSAFAQVRLSQNHLVYLKSDRSAQNYTGNTISFLGSTLFEASAVRNSLSAEVFANYSVYDFMLPSVIQLGGRDYLIRGVNGADSVSIALGGFHFIAHGTASLESNMNLRLYERGAYNAGAFTERPLLRTTEFSGDLTVNITDLSSAAPVLLKIGARSFYQLRYAPTSAQSTALQLQERVNRVGPLIILVIDQSSATGLRLYGNLWYSMLQHDSYDLHQSSLARLVEGTLGVRWTF